MPFITTQRGLKWHYNIAGEGESILFIHGFGVTSQLWCAQVEHFSQNYQTIVVDLPGHGESGWQDVSLNDMAVDLNEILKILEIERVNVVGSSFGGLVGLYLLKTDPERISRLSFVGSLPKFSKSQQYPAGLDMQRIRKLSSQLDGDIAAMLDIFFRSLFSSQDRLGGRYQWIKQFHKTQKVPHPQALKKFLDILEYEDARDMLARIHCRVQFINGTQDYIVPVKMIEHLQEMLPYANFDNLDGVGHFPFLTKPKEFNELLEGFLTS